MWSPTGRLSFSSILFLISMILISMRITFLCCSRVPKMLLHSNNLTVVNSAGSSFSYTIWQLRRCDWQSMTSGWHPNFHFLSPWKMDEKLLLIFRVMELFILKRVLTVVFVKEQLVMYGCILSSGYRISLTFECPICYDMSSLNAIDIIFLCIFALNTSILSWEIESSSKASPILNMSSLTNSIKCHFVGFPFWAS